MHWPTTSHVAIPVCERKGGGRGGGGGRESENEASYGIGYGEVAVSLYRAF